MSSERPDGLEEPVVPGSVAVPGQAPREANVLSEAAGRSAPRVQGNFFATNNSFLVSWGRAIVLGIRDTADEMLDEGRKGAREAFDEGWEKFDTKTRYRRAQPHKPSRRGKRM